MSSITHQPIKVEVKDDRICSRCGQRGVVITHLGKEMVECPNGHREPRKKRQPIGWAAQR